MSQGCLPPSTKARAFFCASPCLLWVVNYQEGVAGSCQETLVYQSDSGIEGLED